MEIATDDPSFNDVIVNEFNTYVRGELIDVEANLGSLYSAQKVVPMIPEVKQFQISKNMYEYLSNLTGINPLGIKNQ